MNKEKELNSYNGDFLRDYQKLVVKEKSINYNVTKEWVSNGDYFVKFSLFKESTSGKTSTNSVMTNNIQGA